MARNSKNNVSSRGGDRTRAAVRAQRESVESEKLSHGKKIITGIVCLALGLFASLGYFSSEGIIIKLFCGLIKGLFGWGFYFVPPVLIIAGVLILFDRENKLKWKTIALLLLPYIIGALYQLLATKAMYELSFTGIKHLWLDGTDLISGGVLSGLLALIFSLLFSDVGAGIILFAALLALLLICVGPFIYIWIGAARARRIEKAERMKNEPQPEPEKEKAPLLDVAAVREKISAMKENRRKELKRKKSKQTTAEIPVPEIRTAAEGITETKTETENGGTAPEVIAVPAAPAEQPAEAPKKRSKTAREDFIREFTEGMEFKDGPQVYRFPPIEMLSTDDGRARREPKDEVITNKERLESALESFGVNANVSNIIRGPSVTRYEMELEAGVKLNKLTNLADDIALSLGVTGVRIAAIPNKIATVGIEVPNRNISNVYLRDIIDSEEFRNSTSKLTFALGKNIAGEAIVGNIAKLPHLLVAGTTGSGKSVCLNSLILSILYKATPEEVKFIMIDPKMVEFKIYNGIPHLLVPVVTEAKKSAGALQWVVTEMMKRYSIFSELGVRDLRGYNKLAENDFELNTMPQIVVVIDELADLMLVAAKEVEESICRVAQLGRAAGIHLVIATQSPRADVITGLMKANIPSRISFKVASSLESRIILDAGGSADKLLGNGDMLYAPVGVTKPMRIQGTWVTDEERENILNFIKDQSKAEYNEEVIYQIEKAAEGKKLAPEPEEESGFEDVDEMFNQAVEAVMDSGQASVSYLQRRLKVGYARAARLVDQMEEKGIVGPFEGSKPRQLLITRQQWQEMQFIHHTAPAEYSVKEPDSDQQDLFSDDEI